MKPGLKPGVSLKPAQTEMSVIARRLEEQYPVSNRGRSVAVTSLRDEMVGESLKTGCQFDA